MSEAIAASAATGESPSVPIVPGMDEASSVSADVTEFINFAIGDEQYGVDIMAVREIKEWSSVTHLPKQPEYVRGVLNLRGVIVPIIDLRCRFGQGVTDATPTHIVIIVQVEGRQVGLLADRVLDIVSLEANKIQPVPKVAQSARVDFLSGIVTVGDALIALIDLPYLLATQVVDESRTATGHASAAASQRR
jgi:purine-binding chemotaxis protein CheW